MIIVIWHTCNSSNPFVLSQVIKWIIFILEQNILVGKGRKISKKEYIYSDLWKYELEYVKHCTLVYRWCVYGTNVVCIVVESYIRPSKS